MSGSEFKKEESHSDPEAHNHAGAIFSVHNLSFSYTPERKVLDNINLTLYPGESIGISGLNGAGKTTLFRCISGLNTADSGEIRLASKVMRSEKDFCELRRNVGYVLQNAEDQIFFPVVLEDVTFGPLNLGFSAEEAKKQALDSLEMVGLGGYENRLSYKLSGGEKHLLALASILAMRPRALLLDEPLTGLDETGQDRVMNILASLDCAKLVIAHDQRFLNSLCSKQLVLKNGSLSPLL